MTIKVLWKIKEANVTTTTLMAEDEMTTTTLMDDDGLYTTKTNWIDMDNLSNSTGTKDEIPTIRPWFEIKMELQVVLLISMLCIILFFMDLCIRCIMFEVSIRRNRRRHSIDLESPTAIGERSHYHRVSIHPIPSVYSDGDDFEDVPLNPSATVPLPENLVPPCPPIPASPTICGSSLVNENYLENRTSESRPMSLSDELRLKLDQRRRRLENSAN